jgi:hypothetical protein
MTAGPVTLASTREESLDHALRPVHDAWLAEARRFLEPSFDTSADFWSRWGGVRYLADEFLDRLRVARALVRELRPFVAPEVSARLERGGQEIVRVRLELDRIGRRRGSAVEFAGGSQRLLTELGVWFAEIELAATVVARDVLPPEAAALLAQLEALLPLPE